MAIFQTIVLALIQGVAELLPVSSSAHVIVAEKLMGLNPASPEMTFLLVMLHSGTSIAVLIFFWNRWKERFFPSPEVSAHSVKCFVLATVFTGIVGYALKHLIEHQLGLTGHKAEIEELFGNLKLISLALAVAGILIIIAGLFKRKAYDDRSLTFKQSGWIGALQGLCLPFRGLSRSGTTISTGMLVGVSPVVAEDFSFALAIIITPPVVVREGWRLFKSAHVEGVQFDWASAFVPGLIGMVCAFAAGWVALKWLSSWIEHGKWKYFGFYCLAFSLLIYFSQ